MYRIDPNTMTPGQITATQQKWADYCRLRHRPVKQCKGCGQTFPNDRVHFAISMTGRVLGRCRTCASATPDGKASRLPEPCPCCGQAAKLVRDRAFANGLVKVCRSCLQTVNALTTATPVTFDNLMKYAQWRKENAGR